MHLIKVNAINSTNSFARDLFKENPKMSPTCIVARQQLNGRGQRGTSWLSPPGQNLTFTVVYPRPSVSLNYNFLLSAAVSTTIIESLETLDVPNLKVKWPNDIMTANLKIGGILIENVITEGNFAASIIGVGLNVNQTRFEDLPSAGSLRLVTGRNHDLDQVLNVLIEAIRKELDELKDSCSEKILSKYKKHLFRLNRPSTFQLPDQSFLTGMIHDVGLNGKLVVKVEDNILRKFDLKEIRLCY